MAKGKHAKQSYTGVIIVLVVIAILAVSAYFAGSKLFAPKVSEKDDGFVEVEVLTPEQGQEEPESQPEDNPFGIDPTKPMIALTFDDGPSQYTWDIVKTLADNHSRATFFEVGNRISTHQAAIDYVIANHNEVASHTFDHKDLTKVSREEAWAQVENTDWMMWAEHDVYITLVRVPYGAENATVLDVLKEKNHPNINWSVDTLDWKSKNKDMIADEILTKAKDGDIVLMHDVYEPTAQAVAIVVPKLIEQGYQLVTVSELMKYKGIEMESGVTYRSAN